MPLALLDTYRTLRCRIVDQSASHHISLFSRVSELYSIGEYCREANEDMIPKLTIERHGVSHAVSSRHATSTNPPAAFDIYPRKILNSMSLRLIHLSDPHAVIDHLMHEYRDQTLASQCNEKDIDYVILVLGSEKIDVNGDAEHIQLHASVQRLQDAIEEDTRLWQLFNTMFSQVPHKRQYEFDGAGRRRVMDYKSMCSEMNQIISSGPRFNEVAVRNGLSGQPLEALLSYVLGTSAGFAAFQDPQMNALFKGILNAWGQYLKTVESRNVLNVKDGWLSPAGLKLLAQEANGAAKMELKFSEIFVCDPEADYYGFQCWDDFFTRHFVPGVRPVAYPDDDSVIANCCESQTQLVHHDIKARDQFWLKTQPHSLMDMLANDPLAGRYVGGTAYQALLSAVSYHRWHSPVAGTVKKSYVIPGKYYSVPFYEGVERPDGPAVEGLGSSPSYQSAVATRALIFIEADNENIGLVCVIAVGLAEVSTVDITVQQGQRVNKGDELGMFHFGGSTWVMLLERDVDVYDLPQPDSSTNVPLNSKLATVGARRVQRSTIQ